MFQKFCGFADLTVATHPYDAAGEAAGMVLLASAHMPSSGMYAPPVEKQASGLGEDVRTCLFCNSHGPFRRPEHVIPEALGNDDLILRDEVCDKCNQFFGSKVESFVLGKTPLAFWRTFLGIRKKRGALPHVDLSLPGRQKGRLPAVHNFHDNLVGFTCHDDYSVSVDIDDDHVLRDIRREARRQLTFVFTPLVLSLMGRFFCKVGIELVCLADPKRARSDVFTQARQFARFGEFEGLWPIFHIESGSLLDLRKRSLDSDGPLDEVFCYHYCLLNVGDKYVLSALTIGTDTWVVSLNDPFPTKEIGGAFPRKELILIWYSPEELRAESAQQVARSR